MEHSADTSSLIRIFITFLRFTRVPDKHYFSVFCLISVFICVHPFFIFIFPLILLSFYLSIQYSAIIKASQTLNNKFEASSITVDQIQGTRAIDP